jgi:hypothetical protein
VLMMVGNGLAACGGAGGGATAGTTGTAARQASPPVALVPEAGVQGEGIGLGLLADMMDASPDAGWKVVDAAAFANKPINGRLDPAVIQKVVRANFDPMRRCYEDALKRNRNLQGRVATKFVIDREGAVTSAEDFHSDIPDREVIKCVVDQYRALHFPKPEGGIVTVVYPIIFNPSD